MAIRYKVCPECGSKDTVKIAYGEPTAEMLLQEERGEVVIGGCSIPIPTPEYHCRKCGFQWSKEEAVDRAYRNIEFVTAYVGGFFGTSYRVEWNLKSGAVTHKQWENSMEEYHSTHSTNFESPNHLELLKATDLLKWKRDYQPEEAILDGTSWSVEIKTASKVLERHGSNAYPKKWDLFCELMEKVSGKRFS